MLADSPILYFNENQTRTNKELFETTRTEGEEKQKQYKFSKKKKKSVSFLFVRIPCVEDIEKMV